MKKISLLFACIGIISFTANAQEKATRTQEPVKVAPVQRVDKVAPAPVVEVRSEPAPVTTNNSATGKVTTTATPLPKLKRTAVKTTKVPQKAVPAEK